MEALQERINSFSKTKRVKRGTIKWPHPSTFLATPEALAEAGFYHNPTLEDKDNVTCFECKKQLSEWEEQDDPFDTHWTKCGDKCCWATVRCGLRVDMDRHGRFTFPDKTRLPGTERMENARLGTFTAGDGWVHDQTKNHGASSRKMAQAGFVWTPQHLGDDLATCLYCNIALSGWEKDDDPLEEHRKRVNPGEICPFFTQSKAAASTSRARAPKGTKSRGKSVGPSRKKKNDSDAEEATTALPKRKTRKATGQGTTDIVHEEVPPPESQCESEGEDVKLLAQAQPPRTRAASIKPLSRSQSKKEEETANCVEDTQPPTQYMSVEEEEHPVPAINEITPKPKTPEPQILPPLSRIPFVPLQTLTDAELDMTVEEWIRYQVEVEFDKLRRDGERELMQLKVRAEEVRKVIEKL